MHTLPHFSPSHWTADQQRLSGTADGLIGTSCEASWTGCDPEDVEALAAAVQASGQLVANHPHPLLPIPLGLARGPDGVALVTEPIPGPTLASLAPLPIPVVMSIFRQLALFVTRWTGLLDTRHTVQIDDFILQPACINLSADGQLTLARIDRLVVEPGDPPWLEQGTSVTVALGLTIGELLMGPERLDEWIDALQAGREPAQVVQQLMPEAGAVPPGLYQLLADMTHEDPPAPFSLQHLTRWLDDHTEDLAAHSAYAARHVRHEDLPSLTAHPWVDGRFPISLLDLSSARTGPKTRDTTHTTSALSPSPHTEMRYAPIAEIGTGGMGRVIRARDTHLHRDVALKVLRAEDLDDALLVERFRREVLVTALLQHPNVAPVYSVERASSGAPAFTMKLIEGETFREYLARCAEQAACGVLTPQSRLDARLAHFLKICDAVAYAHSRGVIHRDLKPENVMVGPFNEVYVMDWGIAGLVGREDLGPADTTTHTMTSSVTHHGDVIGTPSYMSPEQAAGDTTHLTAASDQFTLGLMLFEVVTMMTARTPMGHTAQVEAASSGWHEPMLEQESSDLPSPLRAIIRKATSARPEDRYDSVSAFADDIRNFQYGEEVQALPDTTLRRLWRWLHRHPEFTMAVSLTLVVLTAIHSTYQLGHTITRQSQTTIHIRQVTTLLSGVGRVGRSLDDLFQNQAHALEQLAAELAPMAQTMDPDTLTSHPPWQEATARALHRVATPARPATVSSIAEPPPTLSISLHLDHGLSQSLGAANALSLSAIEPTWWTRARPDTPRWHHARTPEGRELVSYVTPIGHDGLAQDAAAISWEIKELIPEIHRLRLPGISAFYLVEPDGDVILQADTHGEILRDAAAVTSPALLDKMRLGQRVGYVTHADHILAYDHLETMDWYLVVQVERDTYLLQL